MLTPHELIWRIVGIAVVAFLILVLSSLVVPVKANPTRDELCLARNVYFEARGEGFEAQLAVAHVTLNRLDLGVRPTICGVVYQPRQFSWTTQKPHYPRLNDPHFELALYVARLAMGDRQGDPTFGATHFDGARRNTWWAPSATYVRTIEGHSFYWGNR